MNDADAIIDRLSRLPGVVGAGWRDASGALVVRCVAEIYWPAQVEQIVAGVITSCVETRKSGLIAHPFCWQFERAWIYCGSTAGGGWLVLLTENNPGDEEQLRKALLDACGVPQGAELPGELR